MADTHPRRASSSSSSSPAMPSRSPVAGYHSHHAAANAASEKELLDLLTSMPSSFPHSQVSSSSPSSSQASGQPVAGRRRPLATLSALRRPPIDPIILAASLSSGPQVTRHHFHHTYGETAHGPSRQMPASQRQAVKAAQSQQAPAPAARTRTSRSQSTSFGSYANCDMDDSELQAEELIREIEPVPEVTDSERAMYASRQAPRSVRIELEEEAKKLRTEALKQRESQSRESNQGNQERKLEAARVAQVASSVGIRASEEEGSSSAPGTSAPTAPPGDDGQTSQRPQGTAALIQQALSERKAIASAPTTPALPSTPRELSQGSISASPATAIPQLSRLSSIVRPPPLQIRCYARTRIPTPHGEIFCHLYRNNRDNKEHLALVIDPAQNEPDVNVDELSKPAGPPSLRSRTLDEVWSSEETEMERIVRGAYVGRLGPHCQVASAGIRRGREHPAHASEGDVDWEAPLVRIHSECYTGETIGSQRCDCGEQLDEALRLILQSGSGTEPSRDPSREAKRPRLPRGVVVYLRQEGRGIGLLDKLMAYNLQDMGHDTVSANVLLGHLPDARSYAAAGAILEDLGVSSCRLLTNNPEKMEALEAEGIKVKERVGMVPRAWTQEVKRSKGGKSGSARKGKKKSQRVRRPAAGPKRDRRVAALASSQVSDEGLSRSILSQAEDDDEPSHFGRRHQGSDLEGAEGEGTQESASSNDEDDEEEEDDGDSDDYQQHMLRSSGATLIGGAAARGVELERYLRTKIERMGHLLDLPAASGEQTDAGSAAPAAEVSGLGGEGRSTADGERVEQGGDRV
ncbi:hypothetical protein BCV69DRAFT_284612 [Microstroma glucosiphilum]|uniref:GTP cyclohydrolase II n=1 Tax=Pseudomicrostroma glucosiphilum TaxID=1684307 RepID=A0A316U7T2_9BASI|nr:hypothetical protein BCV69DRAFT_284612 [Pseudomicrostroma glucosiphilum]PWN19015.1 hypothetical protein BCV69DRAFT_284612 [Pseudomicrostroma glucosiphilum]